MGRSGTWQGPGLSHFVAKFVSVQVEVGDGHVGLQRRDNNFLDKTKHDLATVQFEAKFYGRRDANMKIDNGHALWDTPT